jgi:hypothetical protein
MLAIRKIWLYLVTLLAVLALTACGQIDDDLSDCPPPEPVIPEKEYELNYEMKLVTNLTTELQTQLNAIAELEVSGALASHLSNVFRGYAHDVDLSFFDTELDSLRLHHEAHIMNDNESCYTLHLPKREYMHLASANIVDNSQVLLNSDERCHYMSLQQVQGDTINSHETGLFTARSYMNVLEGVDQTFNVKLYMANAAAALVVDTAGVKYKSFYSYARGFATDFQMADSAYVYPDKPLYVRAIELALSDTITQVCFCSVNFPSRNPDGWWMREKTDSISVKSLGKTPQGFAVTRAEGEIVPEGEPSGDPLWEYITYVTLEDGSVTKTTLTIAEPLLAGELKVIKGVMDTKGEVHPVDQSVGCSVTLDWTPGMNIDTEL